MSATAISVICLSVAQLIQAACLVSLAIRLNKEIKNRKRDFVLQTAINLLGGQVNEEIENRKADKKNTTKKKGTK